MSRSISVVLATREPISTIRARVSDILANSYPSEHLEIVVGIDRSSSSDVLPSFTELSPSVIVVLGDEPGGKAATLNAAVRAASGDILVFTDSAQRFGPGALAKLAGALTRGSLGAVTGALELARGEEARQSLADRYWRYERWLRSQEARVHSSVGVTGAIWAMPRNLWTPLPLGLILDDLYTPMRLVLSGRRIAFARDAVAFDDRLMSAGQEYRRKVRTLTGVLQLCAWMPLVLLPFRNPIWVQFVFHKLRRLATPYLGVLLVVAALASMRSWLTAVPGITPARLLLVLAILMSLTLLSRRARRLAIEAITLQVAVVRATLNGSRGRWDVW
jgi:cellulose synthase/poly-beta-1,6-N-acetylglucosamine synthase-like glycosyltransferase